MIALVAAFFTSSQQHVSKWTADKFIKAVDTKDYREAADLLSTDNDKWTKDEAESFYYQHGRSRGRYRHRAEQDH